MTEQSSSVTAGYGRALCIGQSDEPVSGQAIDQPHIADHGGQCPGRKTVAVMDPHAGTARNLSGETSGA